MLFPHFDPETHIVQDHPADLARRSAISHIHGLQINRIALGLDLLKIEANEYWRALGFESFAQFCAAPMLSGGLGIVERSRQAITQVARVYVVELGITVDRLAPIPYSNLQELVSVVNESNVETVLSDAESLAQGDVRKRKSAGVYTNGEQPLAPADEPEVRFSPCRYCGGLNPNSASR